MLVITAEFQDPAWEDVFKQGGMHIGGGRSKRFVEINENQVFRIQLIYYGILMTVNTFQRFLLYMYIIIKFYYITV